METMLGCETRAISSASRRNCADRVAASALGKGGRTLMATIRFSETWRARYTTPIPPWPRLRTVSKPGIGPTSSSSTDTMSLANSARPIVAQLLNLTGSWADDKTLMRCNSRVRPRPGSVDRLDVEPVRPGGEVDFEGDGQVE